MANADIVVNDPRTPVAKIAITPSLTVIPADIAPNIIPKRSEPNRLTVIVA